MKIDEFTDKLYEKCTSNPTYDVLDDRMELSYVVNGYCVDISVDGELTRIDLHQYNDLNTNDDIPEHILKTLGLK